MTSENYLTPVQLLAAKRLFENIAAGGKTPDVALLRGLFGRLGSIAKYR